MLLKSPWEFFASDHCDARDDGYVSGATRTTAVWSKDTKRVGHTGVGTGTDLRLSFEMLAIAKVPGFLNSVTVLQLAASLVPSCLLLPNRFVRLPQPFRGELAAVLLLFKQGSLSWMCDVSRMATAPQMLLSPELTYNC